MSETLPQYVIDAIDEYGDARAAHVHRPYAYDSGPMRLKQLEAAIKQYGDDRVGEQLSATRVMKDQMR